MDSQLNDYMRNSICDELYKIATINTTSMLTDINLSEHKMYYPQEIINGYFRTSDAIGSIIMILTNSQINQYCQMWKDFCCPIENILPVNERYQLYLNNVSEWSQQIGIELNNKRNKIESEIKEYREIENEKKMTLFREFCTTYNINTSNGTGNGNGNGNTKKRGMLKPIYLLGLSDDNIELWNQFLTNKN